MAGPAPPPSAPPPHEDTPPPQYCEVVTSSPVLPQAPEQPEDSERGRASCRVPVLVFGIVLTLSLTVILGCMVGDLWVRLETLQVRVEHRNEKEVAKIKTEVHLLKRNLQLSG